MMNCLHCNEEYNGDPRSLYCGTICRKRAENARARLKKLPMAYIGAIKSVEQAEAEGDRARARRASEKAKRILIQIESMTPLFTREQSWLMPLYVAIGQYVKSSL